MLLLFAVDAGLILGWVIVAACILAVAAVALVTIRKKRNQRRELRLQRWKQRIQDYRTQAIAVLDMLAARELKADTRIPEPRRQEIAKQRKLIEYQLAVKTTAQQGLHHSKAPDAAVGVALAVIQQQIAVLNAELAALPSDKPQLMLNDRTWLDEAIARCPDNAYLYARRANLSAKDPARNDEAFNDSNRALQLFEDYPYALFVRGLAHHNNGEFVEAIQDYRKVIELDPSFDTAYTNICCIYNEKSSGKHRDAVELALKALRILPDSPYAHEQLAIAYEGLGDPEKAVYHLTQILDHHPSWTNYIRPKRAKLLAQIGNSELALHEAKQQLASDEADVATYDVLVQLEPNNPDHYAQRAYWQDDTSKKIADLVQAFRLYHNKCNRRGLTPDEAESCIGVLQGLGCNLDHQLTRTTHRDELFDCYRHALATVLPAKDSTGRPLALLDAVFFAQWVGRYDQALTWGLELLPLAEALPPGHGHQQRGTVIMLTYGQMIYSLAESGRLAEAVNYLLEVIPKYDQDYQLAHGLNDLFTYSREHHDYELIAQQLDRLVDHFIFHDATHGDPAYRLHVLVVVALVHATWRDTPLFDLQKARHYAEQAYHTARQKAYYDIRETIAPGSGCRATEDVAGLYYAVCEAIKPGSGRDAIAKDFPNATAYRRVIELAKETTLSLNSLNAAT